eukprot:1554173-Amphidinium_carterae.1
MQDDETVLTLYKLHTASPVRKKGPQLSIVEKDCFAEARAIKVVSHVTALSILTHVHLTHRHQCPHLPCVLTFISQTHFRPVSNTAGHHAFIAVQSDFKPDE